MKNIIFIIASIAIIFGCNNVTSNEKMADYEMNLVDSLFNVSIVKHWEEGVYGAINPENSGEIVITKYKIDTLFNDSWVGYDGEEKIAFKYLDVLCNVVERGMWYSAKQYKKEFPGLLSEFKKAFYSYDGLPIGYIIKCEFLEHPSYFEQFMYIKTDFNYNVISYWFAGEGAPVRSIDSFDEYCDRNKVIFTAISKANTDREVANIFEPYYGVCPYCE